MTSVRTTPSVNRLVARRLQNQLLTRRGPKEPPEIVAWLGAVQAQDYGGAKWALGLRATGLTDADVERSFNQGGILRTHVLRPTWHFVTPGDIRWMLALSAPRVKAALAYQLRAAGLDQRTLVRGARAIERALEGGRSLTRAELGDVLRRAGLQPSGQRYACVIMHAELDGLICSGARRGNQHTHALLDERVPPAKPLGGDEALAELTTRYFRSHGPATAADFAWWSGLTVSTAKRGIQIVKRQLVSEDINGATVWSFLERGSHPAAGPAHLLPNWDEYVVGYRERETITRAGLPHKSGARGVVFNNTVLIGGRIAGSWQRKWHRNGVTIEANRDTRWSEKDTYAVRQGAKLYSTFMGRPVALAVK
jgi:hypothetical protein